jgi:MarR family transcriptional regulator for hemolysin
MKRDDLKRRLATRMSSVSRAWRTLADQTLASIGMSNSGAWCLVYLDRLGPARQTDLAREIEITAASLVRTLNQLESAGLIERQPDPADKRANRLMLTARGRRIAGQAETQLSALRRDLLAELPDAEIATALRVCDTLADRIAERRQRA